MIIDKLIDKIKATENPTVVGLDPNQDFIPNFIKERFFKKYGLTMKAMGKAIFMFNKMIIDEVYDLIPAVKPQIAMYERYGISGLKAYIKTVKYAKEKNLIVIGDIKRSDIASTGQAYSDGHIGRADVSGVKYEVFKEDFITINPYLGSDSIVPFVNDCKTYEKGLFVLAKTSNPNSGEIQDLIVDGVPLYEKVGALISKWGEELIGKNGFSEVGAVVGATHPEQAKRLREIMPHTFFLVPGYGAQGGKAEDLAVCFNSDGFGAIVNSSRGIILAYKKEPYKNNFLEEEFAKASRQAVIDMKNDLRRCI